MGDGLHTYGASDSVTRLFFDHPIDNKMVLNFVITFIIHVNICSLLNCLLLNV